MLISYISMENKSYLSNIFCSIPCMPYVVSILSLIKKKNFFGKHVPCIYIY